MRRIALAIATAAAMLGAGLLISDRAEATALGVATSNMRLAAETVDPVTDVAWWRHHRRFHRTVFFHRRHYFHRPVYASHRPYLYRCRWC